MYCSTLLLKLPFFLASQINSSNKLLVLIIFTPPCSDTTHAYTHTQKRETVCFISLTKTKRKSPVFYVMGTSSHLVTKKGRSLPKWFSSFSSFFYLPLLHLFSRFYLSFVVVVVQCGNVFFSFNHLCYI